MNDLFHLKRFNPTDSRPSFDCGDADLNEFFSKDSVEGGKQLISVTYGAIQNGKLIAFFCVSNDSVRREDLTKSGERKLLKNVSHDKRYKNLPAVKIGRLAVCEQSKRDKVGTSLLDVIKVWFTRHNKTGCRFIIVDAYDNLETITFYKKNGFDFLLLKEDQKEKNDTRLMFFDLMLFVNRRLNLQK